VWLAWGDAERAEAACHHYDGDRTAVREQAVREALIGLVRRLETE